MEDSYEDEEFDSEELFRDPNNNAYEKDELRTGPPLDYVAKKVSKLHGTNTLSHQHTY